MACLTSVIEPLRAANEIADKEAFKWALISETGDRIESSAGIVFDPSTSLKNVQNLDQIFLLSSPNSHFSDARSANGALR